MKPLHSLAWSLGTIFVAALVAWFVADQAQTGAHSHQVEGDSLHDWLHENLAITREQEKLLGPIELAFETEAALCREAIRAAGAELAEAIRNYPQESAKITEAREHLHAANGRLEQVTLDHFFAMKKHLNAEQGEKLLQWTHDSIIHGHDH